MFRSSLLLFAAFTLHAETGADAWLRHAPLDEAAARPYRAALPAAIATFTAGPVVQSAQSELVRGIRGMLGRTLRIQTGLPAEPALILGTPMVYPGVIIERRHDNRFDTPSSIAAIFPRSVLHVDHASRRHG